MATLVSPDPDTEVAAGTRAFPSSTSRVWGRPRGARHAVGAFEKTGQYVIDARDKAPDLFEDWGSTDWSTLTWKDVGRPYRVEKWSKPKKDYETVNGHMLPVLDGWRLFNTAFHQFFLTDVPDAQRDAGAALRRAIGGLHWHDAQEAIEDLLRVAVWNRIMRVEDAVWDPRGKRALFAGLDVKKPRILFLGAADGYEAMQIAAMYPGGDIVLVDYDAFCATDRFGKFPLEYPFLGVDPTTGHQRIWYRDEMPIEFVIDDIRNLQYGQEFDVVVSIGLLEHFPDEHKAECLAMHRQFLKPGGYVVMTTPRNQFRSRAFYNLMSDFMNHGYRELMDVKQMGLYAHENGFEVLRAGVIKAHNGLVMKVR